VIHPSPAAKTSSIGLARSYGFPRETSAASYWLANPPIKILWITVKRRDIRNPLAYLKHHRHATPPHINPRQDTDVRRSFQIASSWYSYDIATHPSFYGFRTHPGSVGARKPTRAKKGCILWRRSTSSTRSDRMHTTPYFLPLEMLSLPCGQGSRGPQRRSERRKRQPVIQPQLTRFPSGRVDVGKPQTSL